MVTLVTRNLQNHTFTIAWQNMEYLMCYGAIKTMISKPWPSESRCFCFQERKIFTLYNIRYCVLAVWMFDLCPIKSLSLKYNNVKQFPLHSKAVGLFITAILNYDCLFHSLNAQCLRTHLTASEPYRHCSET